MALFYYEERWEFRKKTPKNDDPPSWVVLVMVLCFFGLAAKGCAEIGKDSQPKTPWVPR